MRDRALLAIGMAGALRRSELVALDMADVGDVPEGLRTTIARSKTDQEGEGTVIAIPEGRRIQPKALLLAWIKLLGLREGPVVRKLTPQGRIFAKRMSDRGVAIVVRTCAKAAGYDPDQISGHSLRAGFLTEAARQGRACSRCAKSADISRSK